MSIFLYLQNEIFYEIFKYMEIKELIEKRKVCKKINLLITNYIERKYDLSLSYIFWRNNFIVKKPDKIFKNKYISKFLLLIEHNINICLKDKTLKIDEYDLFIDNLIEILNIMHNNNYFSQNIVETCIELPLYKIEIFLQKIRIEEIIVFNGDVQIYNQYNAEIQLFVNILYKNIIEKTETFEEYIKNIDILLILYRNVLIEKDYAFSNVIIQLYKNIKNNEEYKYIKIYVESLIYIILYLDIEDIKKNINNYINIINSIMMMKSKIDIVDRFKLYNIKIYLNDFNNV